jgi:hypothetical protein
MGARVLVGQPGRPCRFKSGWDRAQVVRERQHPLAQHPLALALTGMGAWPWPSDAQPSRMMGVSEGYRSP